MRHQIHLAFIGVLLSGCSHIYVGNVGFTSVEICSEELASRMHRSKGCLPPTRAENAQGFYLARYRLQVSPAEAKVLDALAENKAGENIKNHVPSWIGRVFNLDAPTETPGSNELKIRVPPTGNLNFLPLGEAGKRPESNISTELLMRTDMTGAVQKKLSVGAEVNPAEVVDAALKFSGLGGASTPLGLKDVLLGQVIQAGYQRQSSSAAQGGYYYMSMTPEMLDSLNAALALCNWSLDMPPGQQKADGLASTSGPGESLQLQRKADGKTADNCAHLLARQHPEIAGPVKQLMVDLQVAGRTMQGSRVVGIVIGVAILRTVKGQSEMCSRADIGLVAKGSIRMPVETDSCNALRTAVANFEGIKPNIVEPSDKKEAGGKLNDEDKKQLLVSVHAEYARAVYKTLEVHDHTSILAIHWVPVQLP